MGETISRPLPLPDKIPKPTPAIQEAFRKVGIQWDAESKDDYVAYTLPSGWRMVDVSWHEDLPIFYIVDNENNVRFSIRGQWKQTYDNELTIYEKNPPEPFQSPCSNTKEASQTSERAIVSKILKVNPDSLPKEVSRKPDKWST